MSFKNIILQREGSIATITLNRPEALNAFTREMWLELKDALDEVAGHNIIRVIVITGAGRAFSSGMDAKAAKDFTDIEHVSYIKLEYAVCSYLENMEKPVIGAINGYALGNACELSLACDIRIATESAKFGYPEAFLGAVSPSQRLTLLAGMARAKEMLFTGRYIDAFEAERIGLVCKVVPNEKLQSEVKELAGRIMNTSPIALKYVKRAIHLGRPYSEAAIAFENQSAMRTLNTEDAREGFNAFTEKRKPDFKGR